MLNSDDTDKLSIKRICFECVGEAYLSNEIEQNGRIAQCSYCHQTTESYSIDKIGLCIEFAFDSHYYRTSDQPDAWQQSLLADRESSYEWDREGAPVLDAIENAAEIPLEAAEDVYSFLDNKHGNRHLDELDEETEFSSASYYEERGPSDLEWQKEWHSFEQSLKTEARFFSRIAAGHLASVFGGIEKLKTRDGRSIILDAGPQHELDHLYRARVFQSDEKLKEALSRPDLHLGSPPASLASAGRMNARGISVFYGATEVGVAIAEVRPPVGSNVATARFNINRLLCLLDLNALEEVQDSGSIFDPTFKGRLERVAFLRSLGKRITKPVMPEDEAFDYLATQAIADFLATENAPLFDGIIFRSAQSKDGRNVVLFHKAARIEAMEIPDGAEIDVHTGSETNDGWEVEYTVAERVLPSTPSLLMKASDNWLGFSQLSGQLEQMDSDFREITLQIDPKSVEIHRVEWVEHRYTSYKVDRYRTEKHDSALL